MSITVGPAGLQVFYLHSDHLNTPRVATDEQSRIVWRNSPLVEPFGTAAPEQDPDGDGMPFTLNLRFPGQYYDKETGLSYNYFRDYDPTIGRYVQSDPIGLDGGINTYAYVAGNPISKKDPLGLSPALAPPRPAPPPGTGSPGSGAGGANGGDVIPFPGGRDRPSARPDRDRPNDRQYPDDWTCVEWKKRLLVLRENIIMTEEITGSSDWNWRAIYRDEVNAYNARCSSVTGWLSPTIMYDVE